MHTGLMHGKTRNASCRCHGPARLSRTIKYEGRRGRRGRWGAGKGRSLPGSARQRGRAERRGRALCRGHRAPTFGQHLVHRHLVAADAEHPADVAAAWASAAAAAAAGARPGARAALLPTRVEKLLHLSGGSSRLGRGAMLSSGSRAPS